jgi:hypothetical protein
MYLYGYACFLCFLNKGLLHTERKDFVMFWKVLGIIEKERLTLLEGPHLSHNILYRSLFVLETSVPVLHRSIAGENNMAKWTLVISFLHLLP